MFASSMAQQLSGLATALQHKLRLHLMPAPLDLPGYSLAQMWHQRTHADPAQGLVAAYRRRGVPITLTG